MSIQTARTVTDYDGVVRALDRGESVELTSSSAYSGRKVVAEERVAALEADLATATEAAEAARDKALEEAIAEVTHVTSTAHDARVLALAAKRVELLRAKLRAAKEGR